MALLAKLQFGNNSIKRYSREYLLVDFKCHVFRHHNEARPDGNPQCDSMELNVVIPGKEDLNLYEWYVGASCMSGRVLVELPAPASNQQSLWKEVLFEDARCYAMAEEFNIDRQIRRTLKLSMVADELTVDTVDFKSS